MNKEKTIKRLVETGWALQSAHEVWEEIALAVQQRDEEIIEIVKKMYGEHHEYINNSTIGLNAYRQAVIDIIKAINQHNE